MKKIVKSFRHQKKLQIIKGNPIKESYLVEWIIHYDN